MNHRSALLLPALLAACGLFTSVLHSQAHAQSAAASMVRLLESGRIPAERQGNIIGLIATRGDAADLGYLFEQALVGEAADGGFNPENRAIALKALAEATQTRKVVPEGDLSQLAKLFKADATSKQAAVQLAGLWKVESLAEELKAMLGEKSTSKALKSTVIDALIALGPEHARGAIDTMLGKDQPLEMRYQGIASLSAIDLPAATERAAAALKEASEEHPPTAMIEALLAAQNGADQLAVAIKENPPSADNAKLALRAIYGAGRSDPALVAVLNEVAGIEQGPVKLSEEELASMVAEVKQQGNAARGEVIFRRNDLNCFKCHALSKAGGEVGPDLSPLGKTSPPDYVIRSLLDPDESIKEAYQTIAVQTVDGKSYFGILSEENEDQIVLTDANGEKIVVPVDDILADRKGASLMPKGLTGFLTHQEFLDLVRFISELGKAGPYEIRDTLSMQRWRVLREPSESLLENIPDASTLAEEVLAADEQAWKPLYATVAGFLPLSEVKAYVAGQPIYLYGEIEVLEAGHVAFEIEHAQGVNVWVADRDFGATDKVSVGLPEGRHRLTLRVDPQPNSQPNSQPRKIDNLRLNFVAPADAAAQYTVVGGS